MSGIQISKRSDMISGGDGVPGDFICVRQRAGPLVKAFSTDRACFVRRSTDSKGLIRQAGRTGHVSDQCG